MSLNELIREEQLKQEAAEYAKENFCDEVRATARNAYLDCARLKEKRIEKLETQMKKMQEKLKADLITDLKERMQYSTSPSCTKGMELFIKSIKEWELK